MLSDPVAHSALLQHSIFLDPATDDERFWAIGQAFRCPGVRVVVADGANLSPTLSRRLQLAAEAGHTVGLLARPLWEQDVPSWAHARWLAKPQPSGLASSPGASSWQIELLCCKGHPAGHDASPQWILDWKYEVFRGTNTFHLSTLLGCGSASTQIPAPQKSSLKIA